MAEFQVVMKQYNRLCAEYRSGRHEKYCNECPVSSITNGKDATCTEVMRSDPEWFEKTVMDWAAAHPEPRYPTWEEWGKEWKRKFPEAEAVPCISLFTKAGSCENCTDCRKQPIPADIAEKLGIRPIGGSAE